MRWATVDSSRICSPRAASSDSTTKLAVEVLALHRAGGRKWRGRECRREGFGGERVWF